MAYSLVDVEKRHAENPSTFLIPSRSARDSLRPDDTVKLIFEVDGASERLWVKVVACFAQGEGYKGVVRNCAIRKSLPQFGDVVSFGAEHVIAVA